MWALFFMIYCMSSCSDRNPLNIAVLGDSYSTFEGHIPEGYATWYTSQCRGENDVCCVDSTWWSILCKEEGLNLLLNSSYSGSTICHSGYDGQDYADRSYVTRLKDITSLDVCPDIVYVFGGTNDHWAESPLGELKHSDWTSEDMYQTLPAFCYLLSSLKGELPESRIVVIMNTGLNAPLVEGMKQASEYYDVDFLQLTEVDIKDGHPTNKGMRQIKNAVSNHLNL